MFLVGLSSVLNVDLFGFGLEGRFLVEKRKLTIYDKSNALRLGLGTLA